MKHLKAGLLASVIAVSPMAALPALSQPVQQLQSFAPLVEAAKPSVVTVMVEGTPMMPGQQAIPPQMEDFMDRFFPNRPDGFGPGQERAPMPQRGMGSGFIIDASGVIVTNNHVVAGANEITVVLDDGTEYQAELVGRDDRVDIAVLRIDAGRDLPTVEWGDSDAVRVGDWVVAIGNPLGLDGTVTAGIVSARGRDINSGPYDDYLQVDAAINRGNSGGPLFDLDGKVIGVNTAIISPSGGNVGLGFAIPAAQAETIVADLLDDGQVERGWIGVSIQPVTDQIAESLEMADAQGALVAEVFEDGPAAQAGLKAGDVILAFGDTRIEDLRDLTTAVAAADIGADAEITLWRDGKEDTLAIRPKRMEQTAELQPEAGPTAPAGSLEIPELDLALRADPEAGVLVEDAGPKAARSGLREGDRILSMNQTEVTEPGAAADLVKEAIAADKPSLLVLIEREGARRFVTLDISQA